MTTAVERMADWVSALKFCDIPERVIGKAKLQILSVMAATYAGYATRAARAIREVALSTRASGRSTVFPQGDRTSPTVAVMANAAASMALDFDDYLFLGHTGHSAVLGSLALAEEEGLSGQDLLLAQVIANEIEGRLGASVVLGPQNGQLWTHLHAAGCACAGARLLGLDNRGAANALGLSLYQPPLAMWPGFLGPDSKLLSAAFPSRDGLLAARLAAWGLTGPLDILDHPQGFGHHFAYRFLPQMLTGFGQAWVTDTLCFKIYPGCAYVSAALDAFFDTTQQFEAVHHRHLEPADVVAVTVRTTLLGTEMERLSSSRGTEPLTPIRINFSIPCNLALAMLTGRLTPADLDEAGLLGKQGEILALAEKIEVRHDWDMTLGMFERMGKFIPLGALLSDLDLRKMLALRGDLGQQLGGVLEVKPRDVLRIAGFLWEKAPFLVKQAGRVAADGLGRLVGEKRPGEPPSFDLGQADLAGLPMPFGTEVTLKLRGGLELAKRVDIPKGAAGRDPAETTGLVRKKFRDQATRFISERNVEHALDLIERLEQLENLSELTGTLCVG